MVNAYPVQNASEQTVSFTCHNQTLWGMLHLPAGAGPYPAVLMLHGFTGDKTGSHRLFVHAARAFAASGMAALRFDMRGSGDSEGEFQDITVAGELDDAQAALDWLAARADIDRARIGLLGLSLGGIIESLLAGRNPARISGLAYWAAAANKDAFTHMTERTAEHNGQSAGSLMETLMNDGYLMLWGYPVGLPFIQTFFQQEPLEALRHYPGTALIIHNTGDPVVPVSQADAYAEHFGSRASVHKLDGDTHTFEPPPNQAQVVELTRKWFAELWQ